MDYWLPLEHGCGCIVDWTCVSKELLEREVLLAVAPFPCPWHGGAYGKPLPRPSEGEICSMGGGVAYRVATESQRGDAQRNRALALAKAAERGPALPSDAAAIVSRTVQAVYNDMVSRDLLGACHETSALGYVLLREQGVTPQLCIGVVRSPHVPAGVPVPARSIDFDHSWLELEGQPIDVAIARPIPPAVALAPVVLGRHVDDARPSDVTYGVAGQLDAAARQISAGSLGQYMDRYPGRGGLWRVATRIGDGLGLRVSPEQLRQRHATVRWVSRGTPDAAEPPAGRASAPAPSGVGRNAPCPCGSGRKFKKCCAR